MLQSVQLIVLHRMKYRDSSSIVFTYSREYGRLHFVLKGVHGAKGKGAALFFPLSLVEAQAFIKDKSTLHTIKEHRALVPLDNLCFDPVKNVIALFLGEVLYKCVREQEADPELFDFLSRGVAALNACDAATARNFHLWFMARFPAYLGYAPLDNYGDRCNRFSVSRARFAPEEEVHEGDFSQGISLLLHSFLRLPWQACAQVPCHGELRRRFLEEMVRYLSYHLDRGIEINSLVIMSQIFHTFAP